MFGDLLNNKKILYAILIFFAFTIISFVVGMIVLISTFNSLDNGENIFINISEAVEKKLSIEYPDYEYRRVTYKDSSPDNVYYSFNLINEELLKEKDMKLNKNVICESEIYIYKKIDNVINYYIDLRCDGVEFYYEGYNS